MDLIDFGAVIDVQSDPNFEAVVAALTLRGAVSIQTSSSTYTINPVRDAMCVHSTQHACAQMMQLAQATVLLPGLAASHLHCVLIQDVGTALEYFQSSARS